MRILTLETGNNQVKFSLVEMPKGTLASWGEIRNIGSLIASFSYYTHSGTAEEGMFYIGSIKEALDWILKFLTHKKSGVIKNTKNIDVVGHKIIHGINKFFKPLPVTIEMLRELDENSDFAPFDNPHNLMGLNSAMALIPNAQHFALFDTAFHHSIPKTATRFEIPGNFLNRYNIKKFGFQGIAHRYVIRRLEQLGFIRQNQSRVISCCLDEACSVAAIRNGRSFDCTSGFSPYGSLFGIHRSGTIDYQLMKFLSSKETMSQADLEKMLLEFSGVKGLSGDQTTADEILSNQGIVSDKIQDALRYLSYEVRKWIGAFSMVLQDVDCIVLSGRLVAHNFDFRESICGNLKLLKLRIDKDLNKNYKGAEEGIISTEESKTQAYYIDLKEHLEIAIETYDEIAQRQQLES